MTTINIQELSNASKYLVITQQKDPETLITTRVLITDNANNRINVVDIGRGPVGPQGPSGLPGPKGQDGAAFDILSISSGGTNNNVFTPNKIIYFDGEKLSSTEYSTTDLINNINAITGIIEGSGIHKTVNGSNVTINTRLGDGLAIDSNNTIVVDDTIARKFEIDLGTIEGILPINKGGTNNSVFDINRLVYFDGSKLASFPLATGRIITSGTQISVVAGSGLFGGGNISIPNGSVVIDIGGSEDIVVAESAISLSTTGTPGFYSKVLTDTKGRVVSGTQLTNSDIISALGYTPWHPGNDGSGSLLDADLLDNKNSDYYLNFANFTGSIQSNILPDIISPSIFTKVEVNSKGLVVLGTGLNFTDVITGLDYVPLSTSGGTINGNLAIVGDLNVSNGNVFFQDNLPLFSFNNESMLPTDPRGFSFEYGSAVKRTGILAYFPADQQLKLIVDIMSQGDNDIDGGDGSNNFADDIDGGDASSIFVLGNIEGDEAIVLLEHIADQKYVSLNQNQTISGIKTFENALNVYNYINILQKIDYGGPPLFVGTNSGLVTSLNADLLDNQHGSYYRNAINLTGILDYNNVDVSNLNGTPNYIPKFNNLTNSPSRTVDDSIISQSGTDLISIVDGALSIGINKQYQTKSLLVGSDNETLSSNTAAVGHSNTAAQQFSIAAGSGAKTWLPNQLSLGAFTEVSGLTSIGRGQISDTAIGYYGDSNGVYRTLYPSINIPNNKTVLYNINLLFSKFGSSGLASISFSSGLIKNINQNCFSVASGVKTELFNNSQIREYLYTASYNSEDINRAQILSVNKPPIKNNNAIVSNVKNVNLVKVDPSYMDGYFNKLFNGDIALYMNEPITSGRFVTLSNSPNIQIQMYDHGCVTGCYVNFVPLSGLDTLPISGIYKVQNIDNNYLFEIQDTAWSGHYANSIINIPFNSVNFIDSLANFEFTGNTSNNSSTISNCNPVPSGRLFIGMDIIIGDQPSPSQITNIIQQGDSYSIEFTPAYTGYLNNVNFRQTNYSLSRLSQVDTVYIEGGNYSQTVAKTGEVETTASGLRIYISGFSGPGSISPINIYAPINNTGILYLTKKRNYEATYSRTQANFTTYNVAFEQLMSTNNTGQIILTANREISEYYPNYDPYIKFLTASNYFSGILTSGSNIITDCFPSQLDKLVSGTLLYSDISGFPISGNKVIANPTTNTVALEIPFSGSGTTSGLIGYSASILADNFQIMSTTASGLMVKTFYDPPETGIYLTGLATLYTTTGISNININTLDICNMQKGTSGHLIFTTNNTGLRPVDGTYLIKENNIGSFSINNYHLMPDSGISATGFVGLNLNQDHGFLPPQSVGYLSQDIPINFSMKDQYTVIGNENITSITDTELKYRTPRSGIYSIKAVTGYQILINDNNRNLVDENNQEFMLDIFKSGFYEVTSLQNNQLSILYDRRYLNVKDSVYLAFPSQSQYNQNFRITGIRDFNTYGYLDLRAISGTLTGNTDLNLTGVVRYLGHCSGEVERFYNIIYAQYEGDKFEYWGRDSHGLYTDPPLTGYYWIYDSPSLCYSGNLCIHVSGISDIKAIKPNEFLYFDFIDSVPSLDGYYIVNDKINPDVLSLSIPYNSTYLNNSGLVHIINSVENIKTDRDPNLNNTFIKTNLQTNNRNKYIGYLNKFNHDINKWKHGIVLNTDLEPQRIQETIQISSTFDSASADTDIILLSREPLQISIEYSTDKINFNNAESGAFNFPIGKVLYLKVLVNGGAGNWSNGSDASCPRVNILGVQSYNIFAQDRSFDTLNNRWEIVATCNLSNRVEYKDIDIIVSDISERTEKTISINTIKELSATSIQNVRYGFANDISNWYLLFEVYGGSLSQNNPPLVQVVSGFPDNINVTIQKEYLEYPSGWWGVSLQGLPSVNPGTFNPVVSITEESNSTSTINVTGVLTVSDTNQDYEMVIRTLPEQISIPLLDTNINDFGFLIPVWTNNDANFNVIFNTTDGLILDTPTLAYRPNIKCFSYRANINNSTPLGLYEPVFTVSVNQPGVEGSEQFVKTSGFQASIYSPILIDLTQYSQPLTFNENALWSFSINILDGASAYLSDTPPSVFVGRTPNIGTYNTFPLEYNITYAYDAANSRWIANIQGIPDQFGNFASSTGMYNLKIYAEDTTGYHTNNIDIRIDPVYSLQMRNFSYATTGTGFDTPIELIAPEDVSVPNISFPTSLKDSLINVTKTYGKYDDNLQVWQYQYSGQPLTEKWDARLQLIGSELRVQAKGILNDKIYVAGKVETVETENEFTSFKPLKIINLKTNYEFDEGSAWELEFDTEGGLENPLYPPKISMSGFPLGSSCAGYDPNEENQPQCFVQRSWDPFDKAWTFRFVGVPLCIKDVSFIINIIAVDTIEDETFGTDTKSTTFIYEPIEDHPAPSPPESYNASLLPLCIGYFDANPYSIRVRDTCPSPTGITGLITWGTLPAGLTFNDSRYLEYNSPWSDLTGGIATIQGFPTVFANGGTYPDTFNIAVVDARGKSGVLTNIKFNDSSSPINVSPTEMTIYFSGSDYVYSPPRTVNSQIILGDEHIPDSQQDMLRPPASDLSLECLSILPHNNCVYSSGYYFVTDANTIMISGYGTDNSLNSTRRINDNDKVYIKFDNPAYSILNKEYIADRVTPLTINIYPSGHGISTSVTGTIDILKTQGNIKRLSVRDAGYVGNPLTTPSPGTITGILGDGRYTTKNTGRGFQGRFRPAFSGSLSSGVYRTSFNHHEDMNISVINGRSPQVSTIEFTNCYETGYLRVSGVILPIPVLEITDPPPNAPNSFVYDGQPIALATRIAYGNTTQIRNDLTNNRNSKTIKADFYAIQNSGYNQSITTTTPTPINYSAPTILSGLVFGVDISHISNDVFPTYNKQAIPSLFNSYFWVQRAGQEFDPVVEHSFPAHVPVNKGSLIFTSGEEISTEINLVGGYVPNNFDTSNFKPYVSGFVQQPIVNKIFSGSYTKSFNNPILSIEVQNNPFVVGDYVHIVPSSLSISNPVPFTATGVSLSVVNGDVILLSGEGIPVFPQMGGIVNISYAAKIMSGEVPHQIKLDHGINQSGYYLTNTSIDVINITNEQLSTQNHFMPNYWRLNIISGNSTHAYAGIDALITSGTLTNSSPIISNCSVNPEYILKPGYALYADIPGFPNPAIIDSVTNNSITLTQNFTGTSSTDIPIIHSGIDIVNYYDYLLNDMSGICKIHKNLYNNITNNFDIQFSDINYESNGYNSSNIIGNSNNFYGKYLYKIITAENTGLPGIAMSGWNNKKYSRIYDTIATIPLEITSSSSIFSNIELNNNAWSLQFYVTGGFVPKNNSNLVVEIEGLIHTFDTNIEYLSESGVSIIINSNAGINWTDYFINHGPLEMVVYDKLGSDTKFLSATF